MRTIESEASQRDGSKRATTNQTTLMVAGVILILLLVLLLYGRVINFAYVSWDDDAFILQNTLLLMPFSEAMTSAFGNYFLGDYTPLSLMSFWTEAWLNGSISSEVSHTLNILLHLINICLLWIWLRGFNDLTDSKDRNWIVFAVCLLFAVHPLQVESVAWVSERKGLIAAGFNFCALLCFQRYERKWVYRIGYPAFFLLSLLSKMTCIFTPVLMLIIDLTLKTKTLKRALVRQIPAVFIALILGLVRIKAYSNMTVTSTDESPLSLTRVWKIPILVFNGLGFYTKKFLWPINLSIIYPKFAWSVDVGFNIFLCFIFLSFLLWALRKSQSRIDSRLTGCFAALIILYLLPVMNVIPRINYVNDRYLYLPIIGFAFVLVRAVPKWVILVFSCGVVVAAYFQVQQWRGDLDLWQNTVALNAESGLARLNLGRAKETNGDIKGAVSEYEEAVGTHESGAESKALNNLAILRTQPKLWQYYDLNLAAQLFERAITAEPNKVEQLSIEYNLAVLYAQIGRSDKSRQVAQNIIEAINTLHDSRFEYLRIRALGLLNQTR